MAKTSGEEYLHYLAKGSFLAPWVYPNLYYAPGKEFADLIVRYGDELIIFSEKSKTFLDKIDIELAWKRWSKVFEQGAKQIFGAERILLSENAQLYIDARCRKKAPAHITSDLPNKIYRVLVARGSGFAAQTFFKSPTASLAIMSTKSGDKAGFPFSFNPFFEPGKIVHVLDDFTLPVLLRFINTAPDFLDYLRKKEALLDSIEAFTCHGEEELVKHFLTNIDPDNGHGFQKIIDVAAEQQVDMLTYDEDAFSEFSASKAIAERKALDEPSLVVDKFIDYMHNTLVRSDDADELRVEKALRKLANSNRVERRLIGRFMEEFVKSEHEGPVLVRSMMRGENPETCSKAIILMSVRFDKSENEKANQSDMLLMCNEMGKAYVAMMTQKFPALEEFVIIWFMKDDQNEKRLHSEGIGFLHRDDFGDGELERYVAESESLGFGKKAASPRNYAEQEYGTSESDSKPE